LLDLIKQRQSYNLTDQPWHLSGTSLKYKNILARLEEHPALKDFVNDKFEYVTIRIVVPVENSNYTKHFGIQPFGEISNKPWMPTIVHESLL
jgi:hypothetical protein